MQSLRVLLSVSTATRTWEDGVSAVVSPVPALRAAAGYNVGLLVIRLAAGLTLAVHGSQKLFGWFGGRGVEGTGAFFEQIGYRPGRSFAVVAGLCEFGGGLAFALGVLTPLAASAMIGVMLNAVAADWHKGFLNGFEYPLLIALVAVGVALAGPGQYALDTVTGRVTGLQLGDWRYGIAAITLAVVVAALTLLAKAG